MEEKHAFSGWPLSEADIPGMASDLWACWMNEEVVPVSSTRGRSPSALGCRRSWPSRPHPEQEKTESCLPRKKPVESRAAQTYVEFIGAITFLLTGRNRMSRSRPSGLRTRRKPTLSFRSGRRSLAASLIGSGERSSCSPSGQQTRLTPAKHSVEGGSREPSSDPDLQRRCRVGQGEEGAQLRQISRKSSPLFPWGRYYETDGYAAVSTPGATALAGSGGNWRPVIFQMIPVIPRALVYGAFAKVGSWDAAR